MVKNPPANAGNSGDMGSIPGSGKSPGEGKGNPLQYSCLGNPHGQRSLAGNSPCGQKESDMTKQLSTAHTSLPTSGNTSVKLDANYLRHSKSPKKSLSIYKRSTKIQSYA